MGLWATFPFGISGMTGTRGGTAGTWLIPTIFLWVINWHQPWLSWLSSSIHLTDYYCSPHWDGCCCGITSLIRLCQLRGLGSSLLGGFGYLASGLSSLIGPALLHCLCLLGLVIIIVDVKRVEVTKNKCSEMAASNTICRHWYAIFLRLDLIFLWGSCFL